MLNNGLTLSANIPAVICDDFGRIYSELLLYGLLCIHQIVWMSKDVLDIENGCPSKTTDEDIHDSRKSDEKNRGTNNFRASKRLSIVGNKHPSDKQYDETSSNRYDVLILLFCVGIIAGVLNGCMRWAIKMISITQSRLISSTDAGPFYFVLTATCLCTISAVIIKLGQLPATHGSGMPEVKSLMVNDLTPAEYPRTVSLKILFLRVSSLLFAAGSGLSVGVQGPLVHAAVSVSYCLANYIPNFQCFLDNPSIMKQIFAASAAVGLATVFNAPVGGLLFSVEVTSTYYLISNYWRSFMAATTGAIMYTVFLIHRSEDNEIFDVDYVEHPFSDWELPLFILLGIVSGAVTYGFSILYQQWIVYGRPTMRKYPVGSTSFVATISAVLIYLIHSYSNNGVTVATIVHDAFKNCTISTMSEVQGVSQLGGLFAALFVRMFMTIIGTTLQISCGLFMPMLSIGSLLGRIFGQIVADCTTTGNVYVAGYAIVGAAAFVSGTTHTISCAVIVVEMTGQIGMLLPCLIGAVIACGMNKSLKLSLYDQGMVNKGLESFELLLLTGDGFTQVMDDHAISITHTCQVADLFLMLENGSQDFFPVVDSPESERLVGSICRRDVFLFMKQLFEQANLSSYIRTALPEDTKRDDEAIQKKFLKVVDAKTPDSRFRLLHEASKRVGSLNMRKILGMNNSSTSSGNASNGSPRNASTVVDEREKGLDVTVEMRDFTATNTATTPISVAGVTESPLIATHTQYIQATGLSSTSAAVVEALLETEVDLTKEPLIPLDIFPFTIQEHTTMDLLYVLFEMVKVPNVFVLRDDGSLRGMINKDLLLQNLRKKVH